MAYLTWKRNQTSKIKYQSKKKPQILRITNVLFFSFYLKKRVWTCFVVVAAVIIITIIICGWKAMSHTKRTAFEDLIFLTMSGGKQVIDSCKSNMKPLIVFNVKIVT